MNFAKAAFSTAVTRPAPNFDCFYVYPTVSAEPSLNSDLAIQKEETDIAIEQASRFSSVCNVWAPMYRQATKAALGDGEACTSQVIATAYDSLLAAWKDYLAHDNHGHPVVFIGHSQGAADADQAAALSDRSRRRSCASSMVSAIILGGNVQVADGERRRRELPAHPDLLFSVSDRLRHCLLDLWHPRRPARRRCRPARSGRQPRNRSQTTVWAAGGLRESRNLLVDSRRPGSPCTPRVVHRSPGSLHPVGRVHPSLYTAQCMQQGGATWLQIQPILLPTQDSRPSVSRRRARRGGSISTT